MPCHWLTKSMTACWVTYRVYIGKLSHSHTAAVVEKVPSLFYFGYESCATTCNILIHFLASRVCGSM